jgi:hypothetical protein
MAGIRQNQAALTADERKAFVNACLELKAGKLYDKYVEVHYEAFARPSPAHKAPAFLPWHREFLRRFERDLRSVDPRLSIPYWDWTTHAAKDGLPWTADFMGGDGEGASEEVMTGPFARSAGRWPLTVPSDDPGYLRRALGKEGGLPTPEDVQLAYRLDRYDVPPWDQNSDWRSFRNYLESQIHDEIHDWIGGSMAAGASPNDPVFWLHHANIDRIWAVWQRTYGIWSYAPRSGDGPAGHGLDDAMSPWQREAVAPTPRGVLPVPPRYDTDPPSRYVPFDRPVGGLKAGEILTPKEMVVSGQGEYYLQYQDDGNLVLHNSRAEVLWSSGTAGHEPGTCEMTAAGRFVIHNEGSEWSRPEGSALADSVLLVQDDGNLVVSGPVWDSDTWVPTGPVAVGSVMNPGEVLYPGLALRTGDNAYGLILKVDGNLAFYGLSGNPTGDPRKTLWDTKTGGRRTVAFVMAADGKPRLYAREGGEMRELPTPIDIPSPQADSSFVVSDGGLMVRASNGTPVWKWP